MATPFYLRRTWLRLAGLTAALALSIPHPVGEASTSVKASEPAPFVRDSVPLGVTLPNAPDSLSGWSQKDEKTTLQDVREHLENLDLHRALRTAMTLSRTGRTRNDRASAHMVIGMIHRAQEHHNLASEAFTRVRVSKTPLESWGGWFEAEQDMRRGKPSVAARECKQYLEQWPTGSFTKACQRLVARGLASSGKLQSAREKAREYESNNSLSLLSEQVELDALEYLTRNRPAAAVPIARSLALSHKAPLSGEVADHHLERLTEMGIPGAATPFSASQKLKRAISMRNSGRKEAAWQAYQELLNQPDLPEKFHATLKKEATAFGWKTRNYAFLSDFYAAEYEKKPTAMAAWNAHRTAWRAGQWDDAAHWIDIGLSKHSSERPWRRKREEVARVLLVSKEYEKATKVLDVVGAGRGWSGRRARYLAAMSQYMSGDFADAKRRFTGIIEAKRNDVTAARYWRMRCDENLNQLDAMQVDREWIIEQDPDSWYAFLLLYKVAEEDGHAFARDGSWHDIPLPSFDSIDATPVPKRPLPVAHASGHPLSTPPSTSLALLSWPLKSTSTKPLAVIDPQGSITGLTPYTLPARTYAPSQFYQPGIADKRVKALITSHKEAWPELEGLHLLSEAGLYDLSGAGFFLIRQDMKKARKQRSHPLHDAASRLSSRRQDWTPIFLSMRDHYNSAASTYGMAKNVEDPDLRLSLERLAWPVAHQQQVWTYGRQYDVDPFLAMAIMRVESRYATNAVSRVGARGPMQIMPRTGRLIAAMRRDSHFSIEQLSEPQIAIDYGVGFYSLLMERFNGAYHLAAASYNAGPFAVSAWLQGTGEEMPIDEWVEHIPYHETRRYVKRTSRYYARYINLYTDASAKVVVKKGPFGDDASIVDF